MANSTDLFSPLQSELDQLAQTLDVQSVLIMRSTPTHMRVEATGGPAEKIYQVGAEGKKGSAFSEAHELYCERVVDTGNPLFVEDSSQDPEWDGNEDQVEFGLVNYLGYPLRDASGEVFGTVCILNDVPRTYEESDKAAIETLLDQAESILQEATTLSS
jgi:GAF domain-containing protein